MRTVKAEQDQKAGRLPNDLSRWPFDKLLTYVREKRALHISAGTQRIEKERSGPLLKQFAGVRADKIDARAISGYQRARLETVSGRTVNLECRLLRTVLKEAKLTAEYKALPEDRRGPGRALEPAEERLLLETARSRPGWDVAFYCAVVAANTTARSVEIKTLRLRDVDLIDQQVTICRSKTDSGLRRIPLNAGASWAFARLLERAAALGSTEPEHFLLPRDRGSKYDSTDHQKTWRTAWRKLVKASARRAGRLAAEESIAAGWRAGIKAYRKAAAPFVGLRFHDLRHCAITKLAESDASDATIMAIAGHLSREMMEHYSHVRSAAKRAAVDAISSYVPTDETASAPITKSVQ